MRRAHVDIRLGRRDQRCGHFERLLAQCQDQAVLAIGGDRVGVKTARQQTVHGARLVVLNGREKIVVGTRDDTEICH